MLTYRLEIRGYIGGLRPDPDIDRFPLDRVDHRYVYSHLDSMVRRQLRCKYSVLTRLIADPSRHGAIPSEMGEMPLPVDSTMVA